MTPIAIAEVVSAIYVILILVNLISKHDYSVCVKRQELLLMLAIVWLLSDAVSYVYVGIESYNKFVILSFWIVNIIVYTMTNVVLVGYIYYCEAYLNEKTQIDKWVFRIPLLIAAFNVAVDIVYILHGKIVIYKDGHFFITGTVPSYVLVGFVVSLFYAPVVALIKKKEVGLKAVLVLASYIIPILASVIILYVTGNDLSVFAGAVAIIFGVTLLQRELTEAKIEKEAASNALAENNEKILMLEDKFEALFDVNLETSQYEVYVKGHAFGSVLNEINSNKNFNDNLKNYLGLVWPQDREEAFYVFQKENVIKALEEKNYFEWYFRLASGKEPIWVKVRIIYKNEENKNVIVGIFNAEEEIAQKQKEEQQRVELIKSRLRADALTFLSENDPDLQGFLNFFGNRILRLSGCDQVIFRNLDGERFLFNTPGISDIPKETCDRCPYSEFRSNLFKNEECIIINDSQKGYNGVATHINCPVKSSAMLQIKYEGKTVGLLSINFINDHHKFSENSIETMKTVAVYLGLMMGRIETKKIEKAKQKAETSNRAKTEFMFNMSHDIRTPMNAIIGFNNIAKKNIDDREKLVDCLDKIGQSSELLLSLINSILDMSRIESGKAVLEKIPGNIRYTFSNIQSTLQQLASKKNIDLTFEFGNITDEYIVADFERCTRVFINIITNAIKYSKAGGYVKAKCEQVQEEKDGYGMYRFTFEDNGIGMSKQFQEHLFEQFAREETSDTRGIQGTGLGLSVVKSFVELMNGTIEVNSKQGHGTSFIVTLPFAIQEASNVKDYFKDKMHSMDEEDEQRRNIIRTQFEGKRVLLVDDNELNREIALDILGDEGLITETAEDGSQAVKLLEEKGKDYYDVILMDIQMPVMGGFEATERIRKIYPDMRTPIIALSANAFLEDREAAMEAGMNEHIAKPININELFGVLAKYV